MAGIPLTVDLCGRLAEPYGRSVAIEISVEGLIAGDLVDAIAAAYPALTQMLASGRTKACVNDAIVPFSAKVLPGDVVALFPPVSGG